MARKSRKNKDSISISQAHEKVEISRRIPTAIYARLSEKNNSHDDTDSIDTQVLLVKNYIEEHAEYELKEVFIDNGFSGTNFERPEFIRLMQKIKTGEIQCVVVKDLSRFGRDYVEAGYYIETIFPLLKARLIAVTDNFDSARVSDRNSLTIPIKNMVNAMFAKDVSKKRVAINELKRKKGIQKNPIAPYGYRYSGEGTKLEKVPELVPYVEMLFKWILMGVRRSEIAKRFDLMKVPTPMDIAHKNGMLLTREKTVWNEHMVKSIVINPVYAGTVTMGKTKQAMCNGVEPTRVKRKDWIYFYDMHEGYVTKEEYETIEHRIQEVSEHRKKRQAANKEVRNAFDMLFNCKVFCGECGKPMPYALGGHDRGNKDFSFAYYRCISRKKVSKCSNQRIQQNYLKMVVTDQVKYLIKLSCDQGKVLEKIKKDEIAGNALRKVRRQVISKKRRLKELEERTTNLYADLADEIIDEEEFQLLKERTISVIQKTETEIFSLEQKMFEMEKAIDNYLLRVEELKKYIEGENIPDELLKMLVKKIYVYEGNKIEIVFDCVDVFQNALINECLKEEELVDDCTIS